MFISPTRIIAMKKWVVIYTKPRAEKKFAQYCEQRSIPYELPLYKKTRKYGRKKVTTRIPCFPGYVFVNIEDGERFDMLDCSYVCRYIKVVDQETFYEQLRSILVALENTVVIPHPEIVEGVKVRVKRGPMQGAEGIVEKRQGETKIILTLSFIGQSVECSINADDLELI